MRRVIVSDSTRLGNPSEYVEELRAAYSVGESLNRDTHSAGAAVAQAKHPDYGITSEELAEAQRRFCNYARFRITDTGARQYSNARSQGFESMAPQRILMELRDELADAVNYLTFLDIQLSRWQRRLEGIA